MKEILARACAAAVRCRSLATAAAVAALLVVGSAGSASAQTAPVWPTGVPQIVDSTAVLKAATDVLTFLAMPFILTSLGILALYMIWRFGKRVVSGGS